MPLTLLLTIGIALLVVAIAAGMTARSRRVRPAIMGIGLAALLTGLYLTGLIQLTVNGVRSLIAWLQRTTFDTAMMWGVGLAVGGLVLVFGGSLLSKEPKAPKEPKEVAQQPARAQVPGREAPKPARPKGQDPEDAEIEALLRKRGIM